MADFAQHADKIRRQLDEFLARAKIAAPQSLSDATLHFQRRHRAPLPLQDSFAPRCQGFIRYGCQQPYSGLSSAGQFLDHLERRSKSKNVASPEENTQTIVESLVEPPRRIQSASTFDPSSLFIEIATVASNSRKLNEIVQKWSRIPWQFARIPFDGSIRTWVKGSLEKWILAELARRQHLPLEELDQELVAYIIGLLEHPEYSHPDTVSTELRDLLTNIDTKDFVLALWRFLIIQIGELTLPLSSPEPVTGRSNAEHELSAAVASISKPNALERETTMSDPKFHLSSTGKRQRPSYRGKGGQSGPYDSLRRMLANSMAQLSQEVGQKLERSGNDKPPFMMVQTGTSRQVADWRDSSDPLKVRDKDRWYGDIRSRDQTWGLRRRQRGRDRYR